MPWGHGPGWVPLVRRPAGWDRRWPNRRPYSMPPEFYRRRIRGELDLSGAVTLNSSGAGYVTLAPDGMTAWRITHAQVATSTGPTDQSQATLYRTAVLPHRILGQTAQGGGDTLSFEAVLRPGDTLICLWSGGNPADIATLNVTGTVTALVPS